MVDMLIAYMEFDYLQKTFKNVDLSFISTKYDFYICIFNVESLDNKFENIKYYTTQIFYV